MAYFTAVIFLAASFGCLGESQPPSPSARPIGSDKQTASNKTDSSPAQNEKQTSPTVNPVTVIVSPTIGTQNRERSEGQKQHENPPESRWLEIASVVFTALATICIAVYTFKLSGATTSLVDMEKRQEESTRIIERAYVQLSHVSDNKSPGLIVNANSGACLVSIGIKNHGTTPARITRVFLTKRVLAEQLPEIPDYTMGSGELPEQPIAAFLMKDVEIFVGLSFTIDPIDLPLIKERKKQLVVYGFVDYTDQFGRHFRGGYARNFFPGLVPNNLIFVPQPGYNYDEERT